MADTKEQEPSIEEILESIRQIISEDGEQPAAAAPAPKPAAAAPAPAPKPAPKPAVPQNVLDLTDRVVAEPSPIQIDMQDVPVQEEQPFADNGGLISDPTTDAAAAAMARLLAGNVAVENNVPGRVGNVTLEDMARELMRPLIKSWLDQNLPRVIEKMVAKEIEKISRLALKQ